MAETARILIVDDDSTIRDLLSEGLAASGYDCETAPGGTEGLERVRSRPFELVVSDIDMPGLDGVRLLQEIKRIRPDIEIIMLTGVVDVETAIQSIRLGAHDYLTKPFNLAEVRITVERALEKRRLILENRAYQRDLEEKVRERTEQLVRSYQTTLEALATALDTRDSETLGHSLRVAAYTVTVAGRMGVGEPELTDIYRGALLHDVGKIGVPDAILRKPGKLTSEEWAEMRRHPELGYRILEGIDFLEAAREIVLSHQERYDGQGYPRGLRGKEIPLGARIFSVVDTVDAMTSDRPYRRAVTYERVREELRRHSGTQFDPDVVMVVLQISDPEWETIQRKVMHEVLARSQMRLTS
ncbi:MAG: HD domain-containing phosphohydrolase [Candidatus Polarisedimenticolia bacterium]